MSKTQQTRWLQTIGACFGCALIFANCGKHPPREDAAVITNVKSPGLQSEFEKSVNAALKAREEADLVLETFDWHKFSVITPANSRGVVIELADLGYITEKLAVGKRSIVILIPSIEIITENGLSTDEKAINLYELLKSQGWRNIEYQTCNGSPYVNRYPKGLPSANEALNAKIKNWQLPVK